jgi:hypothetical protein
MNLGFFNDADSLNAGANLAQYHGVKEFYPQLLNLIQPDCRLRIILINKYGPGFKTPQKKI